MGTSLIELLEDEGGATALEYGLMVAGVAAVLIVMASLLGRKVNNALSNVAAHL